MWGYTKSPLYYRVSIKFGEANIWRLAKIWQLAKFKFGKSSTPHRATTRRHKAQIDSDSYALKTVELCQNINDAALMLA